MLFNLSHLITIEDVISIKSTSTTESSEGSDLLEALKLKQSFVCVVARQPI